MIIVYQSEGYKDCKKSAGLVLHYSFTIKLVLT